MKRNLILKNCINSKGFTAQKTQIPLRKATVGRKATRKYKRHRDAALKEDMKSCKKCNRAN